MASTEGRVVKIICWGKRGLCNAGGTGRYSLCSQRNEMRELWRGIADPDAKNNSIFPKLLHLLLALLQSKIVMNFFVRARSGYVPSIVRRSFLKIKQNLDFHQRFSTA